MPSIKKYTKRPWLPEKAPFSGYRHHNTGFYQSRKWRSLRALKLERSPLCEECQRKGIFTPAQMVDHIVPINKGGAPLDMDNLQALCNKCHAAKSARDKSITH
ncbi:MAG: HNH endonuclease [Bacteroidales bacterium]|nr:HNH endonuclease [Bacteroidales bacterium]